LRRTLLPIVLASVWLLSQTSLAAPPSAAGIELPVTMRQNVIAGTTAVGAKVQAKLTAATLVNGVVIPSNAIFSGEVIESVAKSPESPSRLGIRMDSAQWKNGSAEVKVYLTPWYYPLAVISADSYNSAVHGGIEVSRGRGTNTPPANPQPTFPADASGSTRSSEPDSSTPPHRVIMKDVESTRNPDGSVTIISQRSNLKLDKQTTYVLSSIDLLPPK